MTGFPSMLSFLIVALVVIPLGIVLRGWYAKDPLRSLFVLCVLLAFVSPWLALAAFFAATVPGFVFQRGQRIRGN
ncbi:MAG TPA: hypothetical protein VFV97_06290 [Rhodanobacteraceae bacterium]|nr:hypothetical protein [Rhodanobacteraceae bacterium]